MKHFHYLVVAIIFFSCQEKKSYKNVNVDSLLATPPVVKKEFCVNGKLPSVLDTLLFPSPAVLAKREDSRTLLYLLDNKDSLMVTISGCDKPSYQYAYSTTRYYRGTDELRFFYNSVNSFFRMLDKKHQPHTYAHEDLIEGSETYLKENKEIKLLHPIRFTSNGRTWTYTLNAIEGNNEGPWRRLKWSVQAE